MPISIYPPILQSTQPAFLFTTNNYKVYFSLQKITSKNEIGHAQIRIVEQTTNKTVVNTSQFPDGVIYTETINEEDNGLYSVAILSSYLKRGWEANHIYKIQMRFGINPMYKSLSDFATWKQLQIDQSAFSEWSTVMIVKAVNSPSIYIKNSESLSQDIISTEKAEISLTPLFMGYCDFESSNTSFNVKLEMVDKYRFCLYDGDIIDSEFLIEDSGWIQHNESADHLDQHRFKTILTNNKTYSVTYQIVTVNGYAIEANPYTFVVTLSYLSGLEGVNLRAEDETIYCSENGCINLYLTSTADLSGSFVITRSSEFSNYGVWEDLSYLVFNKHSFNDELIFQDFTIESGVKYKYAFQQENSAGLRTSPLFEEGKPYRSVDFEYSFLYHNGIQLRLQFNQKINSFKHTVLSSKQDTLGSKYPHLTRNGYAYYAEFPISGLISLHMDSDQTFFNLKDDGYWYKDNNIIPNDKYLSDDGYNTFDCNINANNIYIERRFREKVEEFLNNFDYKLYKSATEGNIIVVLQNVSLTPNETLGRMIFDFSATAYEVMENTLENLNEFGIIDIGQFESLSSDDISYSFGQISGLFTNEQEIYDLIKEQEEVSIGGGYKLAIKKISSLWIENYPKDDFRNEILELEAELAELKQKGEPTAEVEAQIKELQDLASALESRPLLAGTTLIINGKEISMMPNRIYSLENIEEEVVSIKLKYTQPIIINYKSQLVPRIDDTVGVVSSIDSSRIWGQISGIFTGTDRILRSYDYNYKLSPTYRIYNPQGDDTNINLYKTINIFDIIKEETRKQIEDIYGITNGFTNYNEEEDTWDDGSIYYTFSDMIKFDIEADPGTILYIGKSKDGSDKVEVVIGPTGRYTINPMESLVKFIALKEPQFAIVDYLCLTNQMKMIKQGG